MTPLALHQAQLHQTNACLAWLATWRWSVALSEAFTTSRLQRRFVYGTTPSSSVCVSARSIPSIMNKTIILASQFLCKVQTETSPMVLVAALELQLQQFGVRRA